MIDAHLTRKDLIKTSLMVKKKQNKTKHKHTEVQYFKAKNHQTISITSSKHNKLK